MAHDLNKLFKTDHKPARTYTGNDLEQLMARLNTMTAIREQMSAVLRSAIVPGFSGPLSTSLTKIIAARPDIILACPDCLTQCAEMSADYTKEFEALAKYTAEHGQSEVEK